MVVIANAEPLLDQIPDHRSRPDARLVASLDRAEFDDDRQRFALLLSELRRWALGDRCAKPLDVIDVVPLKPTID